MDFISKEIRGNSFCLECSACIHVYSHNITQYHGYRGEVFFFNFITLILYIYTVQTFNIIHRCKIQGKYIRLFDIH